MALIALLPGDGIGPEVIQQARRVLDALDLDLRYEEAPVGGVAYHTLGHPLPETTLDVARRADALLFGAVGDPTCDNLERALRPEQAILGLPTDPNRKKRWCINCGKQHAGASKFNASVTAAASIPLAPPPPPPASTQEEF